MTSRERMLATPKFAGPDRLPVIYHASEAGLCVHGRMLSDLFCQFPPDVRYPYVRTINEKTDHRP